MKKIEDLLKELHAENDYAASNNFIADGLFDSFDLLRFLGMLENEYGVKIAGDDFLPTNFCNMEAIRKLLQKYGIDGEIWVVML